MTTEKNPIALSKKRYTIAIACVVFLTIATLYDAYSSWILIEVNQVASEANGLWRLVASYTDFTLAMVIRALVGLAGVSFLFYLIRNGRNSKDAARIRANKISYYGLLALSVVFFGLTCWHLYIHSITASIQAL